MPLIRPAAARRFRPECLFRPGSVAVIGAATPAGGQVVRNMLAAGFQGPVLPVGAGLQAVCGLFAYPGVDALPMVPDLAVVTAPAEQVPAALAALGRRGVFAAIVATPMEGLAEAARGAGVRVLGPGSFGVAVPALGLNASRAHMVPPGGRVALVSQSAALCRAVLDWAGPNGVGFSHIVGIGGNADLGFSVALDWLSRDRGTGLILLDIRRIRNRRQFLSALRACARHRPVVAIRAGGRLLDPEGEADAVFEAALRRAGVLSVGRVEDFLAAAETLNRARPARNEALAILTNAIGPGQLAADAALRAGLNLAALPDASRAALAVPEPGFAAPGPAAPEGPVYVGLEAPIRLAEAARALDPLPQVGGLLAVHAPSGPEDAAAMEALAGCAGTVKLPLLVCAMGETTGRAHRSRLTAAGLPVFATPEQAVRGFLHLVQQRRARAAARELPPRAVLPLAPDRAQVAALFRRARAAGRLSLVQDEALAVLAAYGVPSVPGRTAAAPEDAADAAALLGFPVAVKLRRNTPASPEGVAGVALDLADAGQVRRAAEDLAARRRRHAPEAPDLGFLVQRLVGRAHELRIRVAEDVVFGPAIGFGVGGIAGRIAPALAHDLPPLNLPLAQSLIDRTRGAQALEALRDPGHPGREAVASTLVRVSQLVVDFPEIAALELDPLFADGEGVLAADAWVRLRPPGEAGFLAIPPYPAELTQHVTLGGEALTLRPIRPEDAEAHAALFARLSPEDVRYRFFSAMRELSAEQIARMTQIDYEREMAFVAVRDATGDTVGVARLVREPPGQEAEFAVLVQPDMKGRGLATLLMQRLFDWARSQGIPEIVGQVLADNAPMLAFVRHLGFTVRRMAGEEDVMEARLRLG